MFELTMQAGESDLGQDALTPTWGINGPHLAPTLRARRGEHVEVRVTNDLPETSTLHWHGMHLPARMDGGPHQPIAPGDTWRPHWIVDQPAATLWYHPHPHGSTARHVYLGLSGLFIVDDPAESALPLPRDYGVDDIPLIVQDKRFDGNGALDFSMSLIQSAGVVGDTVVVNGTPGPYLDVETRMVRFRILNASNTRPYTFHLEDRRPFLVIGSDGGLLSAPVERRDVQVSAGERVEIVVAFAPGEVVRLQSGPSDTADRLAGGSDRLDVLQVRAARTLRESGGVPDRLVDVPRIDERHADRSRQLDLSGFSINGRTMDMSRVDDVVTLDTTEIWTVTNLDGQTHNFHVHDVQFQILDVDGRRPPPHLAGWKDTVWLPPNRRTRLIMRFTDHADEDWPYMYHCHVLRHEDLGMMGQFLVVERGRSTDPGDYRIGSGSSGHH